VCNHYGQLTDAVKNTIAKIAAPIHAAINKVIDWVVGWVKKMFGKGDGKDVKKPNEEKNKDGKAIDLTTLRISVPTKTEGTHTIYLKKEKKGYTLIIESTPTFYADFINQIETTEENKDEKDKALKIAERLDALMDSADEEKEKIEIQEKLKELSNLTIKIIDLFNLKPLQPEKAYERGQEHGLTWQKSDAINRGKKMKPPQPQGKWGSKKDLGYAGKIAATFKDNDMHDVPINSDNTCIVFNLDGSESKPDRIRIRKNKDNKTFHGFPIDSKTAGEVF
jgi:hypothetical protein